MVYIYGLWDPRNLELRYIGVTRNLEIRLRDHIYRARTQGSRNLHKDNWIRQLLSEDIDPSIDVLEGCTEDNWEQAEKAWIKEALEKGAKLTNFLKGGKAFGSGNDSYWYERKGKNHPTHGLRRIGKENPMWGKGHGESTKKLISEKLRSTYSDPAKTPWYGKHLTDEHKKKLSEVKKGKKQSKEFKEKLSIAMGGKSNPMYGRKHSIETKEKMRVSYALYVANKKGNTKLVLELQEQYFKLYGKYHDKYPYKVDK